MTILKILTYPDARLYKIAKAVDLINNKHRELIKNMAETMYESSGTVSYTHLRAHET